MAGCRILSWLASRSYRYCRRRAPFGQSFLLRTNSEEPDLRRAVCRPTRLYRTRTVANHESDGEFPKSRMGTVGCAACAGRLLRELYLQLDRSCRKWVLP